MGVSEGDAAGLAVGLDVPVPSGDGVALRLGDMVRDGVRVVVGVDVGEDVQLGVLDGLADERLEAVGAAMGMVSHRKSMSTNCQKQGCFG